MIESDENGKLPHRITLGPIEKVIASVFVAAVIGVPSYLWQKSENRAELQDKQLQQIDTRTQVMAQQMATLTAQLADVPSIRDRSTTNTVRIQQLEDQVKELRSMRGLK